jgi:trimethylamine:corrinoid methyltransferase-like protein
MRDRVARFPRALTEGLLDRVREVPREEQPAAFSATAEVYHGYYLEPHSGAYVPWTEPDFGRYVRLAKALPNISGVYLLGCPFVPPDQIMLQPLYEKYHALRLGIDYGGAIWDTALCPALYDLFEVIAAWKGQPVDRVFAGSVNMLSPLKLGYTDAQQVMYFRDKGLRVGISSNGSLGLSYPITVAAALATQMAENLAVSMLNEALFGIVSFSMGPSIAAVDMRTSAYRYGRPEKVLANMAAKQIADHLGVAYHGHTGLSDAAEPGAEAAMQKATSAMAGLFHAGSGYLAAGLLAVDEVFSPIQMIFDDEMTASVRHLLKGVDERDILPDELMEDFGMGNFLASEHTVEHFREAMWQPRIWSRAPFGGKSGVKNDYAHALDLYTGIMARPEEAPCLDERFDREMLKIISAAKR